MPETAPIDPNSEPLALHCVDFVNGHGHNAYGHYTQWLKAHYPEHVGDYYDKPVPGSLGS